MIQHNNHLLVPVPKGAKDFEIINRYGMDHLFFHDPKPRYELLPKNGYSIIGLGDSLTEEQWEQICEFYTEDAEGQITHWTQWRNYKHKDWFDLLTATESARSLISSLGLEFERVIVLKATTWV